MTTTEAAQALGVSLRRVQAMVKAGRLIAVKRGRDWVISDKSVRAYQQTARQPGRPKLRRPV